MGSTVTPRDGPDRGIQGDGLPVVGPIARQLWAHAARAWESASRRWELGVARGRGGADTGDRRRFISVRESRREGRLPAALQSAIRDGFLAAQPASGGANPCCSDGAGPDQRADGAEVLNWSSCLSTGGVLFRRPTGGVGWQPVASAGTAVGSLLLDL